MWPINVAADECSELDPTDGTYVDKIVLCWRFRRTERISVCRNGIVLDFS